VETTDRPTVEPTGRGTSADDRGDRTLMLVPATICLVMFRRRVLAVTDTRVAS
jgi:hypothetical protein